MMLALLLPVWGGTPALAAANGTVRVKLTRLSGYSSMVFKADCACVLTGKTSINIPSGAEMRAEVSGGALTVSSGGVRVNCAQGVDPSPLPHGRRVQLLLRHLWQTVFREIWRFLRRAGRSKRCSVSILRIIFAAWWAGKSSDSSPAEALKAQAVAARNYVLKKKTARANKGYDVTDTTSDQVFKGLAQPPDARD